MFLSVPGPIEPPVVDMVNSTSAIIKWNEPEDPNGIIINYNIEFSALDFSQKPYSDRKRAISEDLLTCFSFLGRNDTVVLQSSETTQLTLTNLCKIIISHNNHLLDTINTDLHSVWSAG